MWSSSTVWRVWVNDDQLSQWRGYGADGHGYSVGFDTSSLTQVKPDPVVYKAVYDEDKQLHMCEYLLRDGMIQLDEVLQKSNLQPSPATLAYLLSFTIRVLLPGFKHPSFAEEKEVRMFLIRNYDPAADQGMFFKERKGLLVPHIPVRWGEVRLPIREIIVGPNLDFEKAKWGLEHLLKQQGYENVEIKKSQIPYLA